MNAYRNPFPLLCALLGLACPAYCYAANFTGTATATVVDDLFTSSCSTLSFGRVNMDSGAGTISVSPKGGVNISGRVSADVQEAKPAGCKVRGKADTHYRIKVPESLIFTVAGSESESGRDRNLLVDAIQILSENKGSGDLTGRLNSKGEDSLWIGATIHITDHTAPGLYEGYVPVTVYY